MYDIVTDKNLWEGVLLFPFALVLWKFKIHKKLADFEFWNKRGMVYAHLTSYEWFSVSIFVAFCLIMLFFTTFDENIILLRVAKGSASAETVRGAGHYLVWVALFIVYARYGITDFLKGGYMMAFLGIAHEAAWYVTYFFAQPANFYLTIYHYGPFLILLSGLLFGWALLYSVGISKDAEGKRTFYSKVIPMRIVALCIASIILFNVLWFLGGFNLSIDNVAGFTQYYKDLNVNLIEDLSWLMPALFLLHPFRVLPVEHIDGSDKAHGDIKEQDTSEDPGEHPHPSIGLDSIGTERAAGAFEIKERSIESDDEADYPGKCESSDIGAICLHPV